MARLANKTLHITEKTWDSLWNIFKDIKCTNDEAIASLVLFMTSLGYDGKELILDYRQSLIDKEKEMLLVQ